MVKDTHAKLGADVGRHEAVVRHACDDSDGSPSSAAFLGSTSFVNGSSLGASAVALARTASTNGARPQGGSAHEPLVIAQRGHDDCLVSNAPSNEPSVAGCDLVPLAHGRLLTGSCSVASTCSCRRLPATQVEGATRCDANGVFTRRSAGTGRTLANGEVALRPTYGRQRVGFDRTGPS